MQIRRTGKRKYFQNELLIRRLLSSYAVQKLCKCNIFPSFILNLINSDQGIQISNRANLISNFMVNSAIFDQGKLLKNKRFSWIVIFLNLCLIKIFPSQAPLQNAASGVFVQEKR